LEISTNNIVFSICLSHDQPPRSLKLEMKSIARSPYHTNTDYFLLALLLVLLSSFQASIDKVNGIAHALIWYL
jgi:hypothetical protein